MLCENEPKLHPHQSLPPNLPTAYRRTYTLLKTAGHTPFTAFGILLDARGRHGMAAQTHARQWIATIFANRHAR